MNLSLLRRVAILNCTAAISLLCCSLAKSDSPLPISAVLDALGSVHPFSEVALSPDGKHVVYGTVVTGKRGGADVDVSSLWIVNAHDGSGAVRLTACPGSVCDEHGAAWSPDGTHIAFVTTDAKEQLQVATADASGNGVKTITHAQGPLDTPRWSPDGKRIAFLYSKGAPRMPGPLNPLARDAGVLSESFYEQRLAVVQAQGGEPTLLAPADLNVYEYDWSPDGKTFAVTAAHGSGDNNWYIAEIFLIDRDSGSARSILKTDMQIVVPRWSQDAQRIAFVGGLMSDESIGSGDIYVIPASGGQPRNLTPHSSGSAFWLTWLPKSDNLLAVEAVDGASGLL